MASCRCKGRCGGFLKDAVPGCSEFDYYKKCMECVILVSKTYQKCPCCGGKLRTKPRAPLKPKLYVRY